MAIVSTPQGPIEINAANPTTSHPHRSILVQDTERQAVHPQPSQLAVLILPVPFSNHTIVPDLLRLGACIISLGITYVVSKVFAARHSYGA